ncbi:hypothetical protein FB107DRAFT_279627 [Schizophyllum commune]
MVQNIWELTSVKVLGKSTRGSHRLVVEHGMYICIPSRNGDTDKIEVAVVALIIVNCAPSRALRPARLRYELPAHLHARHPARVLARVVNTYDCLRVVTHHIARLSLSLGVLALGVQSGQKSTLQPVRPPAIDVDMNTADNFAGIGEVNSSGERMHSGDNIIPFESGNAGTRLRYRPSD